MYTIDNGWEVYRKENKFYLRVNPIENTLYTRSYDVEIDEAFYKDVEHGMTNTDMLSEKHDIYLISIKSMKFEKPEKIPLKKLPPNFTRVSDFILEESTDKYYLHFQEAKNGGGERRIEISKKVYDDGLTGAFSVTDLFIEYNLYHLLEDKDENESRASIWSRLKAFFNRRIFFVILT